MPVFDLRPLQLSLWVALGALILCFPLGVAAARALGGRHFLFKDWIEGLLLLPLVLPPVVTGFALLIVLGKHGPLGDLRLLFTPWSAVLASAIVAFPLVYQSARAAFAARSDELEMVARCLGASRARAFWTIAVPLAWPGLLAGAVLAFARALGEFGATVMVAGNVAGKTLTAPVAIYFAANDGDMGSAAIYAGALGIFNLLFLIGLNVYRRHASNLR